MKDEATPLRNACFALLATRNEILKFGARRLLSPKEYDALRAAQDAYDAALTAFHRTGRR